MGLYLPRLLCIVRVYNQNRGKEGPRGSAGSYALTSVFG